MIDSQKKIRKFCLIGEKISYSASPVIHNFIFSRDGVNASYELIEIPRGDFTPERFSEILNEYSGMNITTPFKTIVASMLDKNLDEIAHKTRSVNTVKIDDDGTVIGCNTDVTGLMQGVFDIVVARTPFPSRLVMLGAGGVARSVLYSFLEQHQKYEKRKIPEIIVAMRKIEKNTELLNLLAGLSYGSLNLRAQFLEWDENEIADAIQPGGLIVNATPLGSPDYIYHSPLNFEHFKWQNPKRIFAIDLVYTPTRTEFLISAEKAGTRIINGVGMLMYQALASQSIWFNRNVSETGLLEKLAKNKFEWIK